MQDLGTPFQPDETRLGVKNEIIFVCHAALFSNLSTPPVPTQFLPMLFQPTAHMQSPGPPFKPDEVGVGVKARIVFVRHGATLSSEDQLLMGTKDEELSTLGEMQASKTAELIMDLKVCYPSM